MIPLLGSAAMRVADAAAVASRGSDALVAAAGTAVALEAKRMLGSCYGARVAVVVGPGLNGADGRVAASWLVTRGARVTVFDVEHQPTTLAGYHLVIDAAFGLGCSRPYEAPTVAPGTLVLALDLPSGVDADTGAILGSPLGADVTLAIGALKPAHVDGPSATLIGELRFAGLGIVSTFDDGLMEDRDLATMVIRRFDDHKWSHALHVLAGSPLMPGAAELCVRGALAGGASMVRLTGRGDLAGLADWPPEMVHAGEGAFDQRCRSVVAGPGLGDGAAAWLLPRLHDVAVPVVLDADGLDRSIWPVSATAASRWVLTPHAGEFVRLTGRAMPVRRFDAVRELARESGCVVLLKGPTTVIASPEGHLRIVRSGTAALATAGTGDVLGGLIGATIARGHGSLEAAALAAHLHGRAGALLGTYGRACDLTRAIAVVLERVVGAP